MATRMLRRVSGFTSLCYLLCGDIAIGSLSSDAMRNSPYSDYAPARFMNSVTLPEGNVMNLPYPGSSLPENPLATKRIYGISDSLLSPQLKEILRRDFLNVKRKYGKIIEDVTNGHDSDLIHPDFIAAVVAAESGGNTHARSGQGAVGLMQLLPETAKEQGVRNLTDARQSIKGGTKYLDFLIGKYDDDPVRALAAYNWGPGSLDRLIKKQEFRINLLPRETRELIQKVHHLHYLE